MTAADELHSVDSGDCASLDNDCENDIGYESQINNPICSQDAMVEVDDDEHSYSINGADFGEHRASSFGPGDSGHSFCSSTSLGGGLASFLEADIVDGTDAFLRKREKGLVSEQEDSSVDTNEDDQLTMRGLKAMLVTALKKRKQRKKHIVQMEANEQERREAIAQRKRKRLIHSEILAASDGIVPNDDIPDVIKTISRNAGFVPSYEGDENKSPKLRNGEARTLEKFNSSSSRRKLRLPKVVYQDNVAVGDWWKLTESTGGGKASNSNEKKETAKVLEQRNQYSISFPAVSELLPSKNENKTQDSKSSGNDEAIGLNGMIAAAAAERHDRIARTGIDATSVEVKSCAKAMSPTSGNDEDDKKNSYYGGKTTLNETITVAADERLIPIKKAERSPIPTKQRYHLGQSERDATSVTASVHSFSDEEENSLMRKEMTIEETAIREIAADTELQRERTKDKLMKAREEKEKQDQEKNTIKKYRVWENVEYDAQQRKKDKDNHRKIFLQVAGEAATYGRLVRLEEIIVEAQGDQRFHGSNTWSGPKLADDRKSDGLRAIQEAAAIGRMRQPKTEKDLSNTQDADFIQNFVGNINNNDFDVDNQVDEQGRKMLRTNFLVDQYVKKTAQGKKERMFADSVAIEDRDHKTGTYESFDDVPLPTDVLPTFKRILGPRSKTRRVSNASDLAVLRMHMSEKNLNFDYDEDDSDAEKIKNNRLRVLESISRDVATSAWERAYRLEKPKAQLKVTRKCFCPYCKDPNPYQTHKYKLLMYPERFLDDSDNNSYCQVLTESSDIASNIAEAAQNTAPKYSISPGGRKKRIIRVVRRRKRKPGNLSPTGSSLGDNKRVIDGSSLTPEELDMLTEQLQKQGSNSLTSDELVQIADALKGSSSSNSTIHMPPTTEVSSNLGNQFSFSPQHQQDTTAELSNPDLNDTTETSLPLTPEKSADMSIDQFLEVTKDSTLSRSLPSIPFTFDSPSTRSLASRSLASRSLASQDNPAKSTQKRRSKKSSKNNNRDHTKSPLPRKSRRKENSDEVLDGTDQSNVGNLSSSTSIKNGEGEVSDSDMTKEIQNQFFISVPPVSDLLPSKNENKMQHTKISSNRKGLVQPQSANDLSQKGITSQTGEISRKKSLRSNLKKSGRSASLRVRNELLSRSDNYSRGKKSPRRGKKLSLSPRPGRGSMSVLDIQQLEDDVTTPKAPRRIKSAGNSKLNRSRLSKELTEADLPRSGRRNASKSRKPKSGSRLEQQKFVKSASISEDDDDKWQPVRRVPSRTKSLPISPGTKEKALLICASSVEDQSVKKNSSRTFGFANLIPKRKRLFKSQSERFIKSQSERSLLSSQSSPSNSNRPKSLSPEQRQRVYEFLTSKNYPLPPSPQTPVNEVNVIARGGDSLKNYVEFNVTATIPEEGTQPPSPQTPSNKVNGEALDDDSLKKPLPSKDSTAKSTDFSLSDLSNGTEQQDHQRLVKNVRRSTSLDPRSMTKSRGRGQANTPRRNKKANVVKVTKMDMSNESFDIDDLPPGPSLSFRLDSVNGPVKQPRRCHSVDRVRIMKQKGRGQSSRKLKNKEGSEKGKMKKNFNLKKWLKKGGKTEHSR